MLIMTLKNENENNEPDVNQRVNACFLAIQSRQS